LALALSNSCSRGQHAAVFVFTLAQAQCAALRRPGLAQQQRATPAPMVAVVVLAGEEQQEECACCCQELPRAQLSRCSKGHVMCATCTRRLNRSDCLFCVPHAVTQERAAPPRRGWRALSLRTGAPAVRPHCAACCRSVLAAVLAFVSAVYAGKVYLWLYMVTQDKQLDWFAWDSFRHCTGEFLLGLFGTAVLVGCCVKGEGAA